MIFSKIDECVKTFKDIDLNCLPVYDVRDIKTKIRTYVCKNIESILS